MPAPTFQDATADDRAATVALWHACGLTRPWNDPDADFRQATQGATSTVLVIRDAVGDSGVAASVMTGFDGHRGWIYYLSVRADRRGAGLGRAAVAAAEAWLTAAGAAKVQLMVRRDNRAALGFYAGLGYLEQDVVTLGRSLGGRSLGGPHGSGR